MSKSTVERAINGKTCRQWDYHVAAHCAVLLEHVIYVIIGSNDHACLNSVVCYKPSNDQWEQGPDMISA